MNRSKYCQIFIAVNDYLENHRPKPHHESITTGSTMPVGINQILILALFINGRKVMLSRIEPKIRWSQECHWTIGCFFIAHVPSHDCSIQEWLIASFLWIVLPDITEMCYHQALVIVNRSSSASSSTCCWMQQNEDNLERCISVNFSRFVPLKNAVATRPSSQLRSNFLKFASVNKSRGSL